MRHNVVNFSLFPKKIIRQICLKASSGCTEKNEVIHNSQHGFAVGKSLNNLFWIHCWLCYEQKVGLKTSQDHYQPEWFFVSMMGTGFHLWRVINGNGNIQLRNSLHCLSLSAWTKWGSILKIQETYIYSNFSLVTKL